VGDLLVRPNVAPSTEVRDHDRKRFSDAAGGEAVPEPPYKARTTAAAKILE
jgi:hypothetical protein